MTSRSNKKSSFHFGQFLKLPLALSVSSCLLMACQSTPKAVTPISEAPASTQAQQSIYNPYGNAQTAQNTATQPVTQPTIQLPSIGTTTTPATQTTQNATLQNQAPAYTGVLDATTMTNLNALLRARQMSLVLNDQKSLNDYGSLWSRIVHATRIAVPNNNPRIEAEKVWFLSNPSYIQGMTARASRYLHYTVAEAERRGIPVELALIPAIESSYDPSAISNANAAGLWQLLSSTGRVYGLTQSHTYDGRRDVIESTRAAYDFLTSLYNQFGNWELAIAAYSAGPGVVQAAIDANRSQNLPIDYWSLTLPKESMHYVPRFLALSQLITNTQKHNVTLANIANRRYFRSVPVNYGISLYDISQATGVSIDELQLLNPALLNGRIESPAPNRVLIPDHLDVAYNAKIRSLLSGGAMGNVANPLQPQRNDYVIASRSFGANQNSENELREADALPTTNAKLTQNNTVVPSPALSIEEKELIIAQLNSANPKVPAVSTTDGNIQLLAITTGQAVLSSNGQPKNLQYGSPVSPNSHQIIAPATNLAIPTPMPTPTPAVTPTQTQAPTPTTNPATLPNTYVVKSGDSLGVIAKKHGMSTKELVLLNKLDANAPIVPGQVLQLKASSASGKDTKTDTKTNSTADNKTAAKPTTSTPAKTSTNKPESYTVQAGDTLIGVAKKYNLTRDQLASYNNLDKNATLKTGDSLWLIPNKGKTTTAQPASKTPVTTPAKTAPVKRGTYTVKAGDTLLGIANRFNTTQTDIAALNNFAVGSRLSTGQVINMPVAVPASENRPAPQPQAEPKNTAPAGQIIKNTESYTIKRGDSLIGLAKQHNVNVEDLAKTNNLSTTASLRIGQTIKVPKLTTSYTVKRGDSLIRLAKQYGISTEELAKMNNLKATDALAIGQVLTVPNR